jgi:acetamidase/formamidase
VSFEKKATGKSHGFCAFWRCSNLCPRVPGIGGEVAPLPAMGRISSMPPGVQAGNLDNKDLVAGTTLYLPVYAAGALFSVGDAHAAQGHGEVDLSAIETGLRGKEMSRSLLNFAKRALP